MRFRDSPALVPLRVEQAASEGMGDLRANHQKIVVWWGTRVECSSAIARQLAAAPWTPWRGPKTIEFVCLDRRLARAAEREGLRIAGN